MIVLYILKKKSTFSSVPIYKYISNKSSLCSVCICVCSQCTSTELLQKMCEVVKKGLEALTKGVATLLPQDCSAITDSAFMQVGS